MVTCNRPLLPATALDRNQEALDIVPVRRDSPWRAVTSFQSGVCYKPSNNIKHPTSSRKQQPKSLLKIGNFRFNKAHKMQEVILDVNKLTITHLIIEIAI